MAPSNADRLIVFLPDSGIDSWKQLSVIHDHQCNSSSSSSSQTPNAIVGDTQEDETKIKEDANSILSALKIQVPSSTGEFNFSHGAEDDPKTPTSTEHRIPVTAACPLAPKKTRWVPATGKRKVPFFPVVGVPAADFIVYVDAMLALNETVYVPDIMVGDLGAGDSKRLKLLPSPAYEP